MKKSEQPSSTIDIDKIFEEGREPTEEEWKEWATNFKPKRIGRRVALKDTTRSVSKAKRLARQRVFDNKSYKEKENYKSWGRKYNEKRKYLYKYNKEWKENLDQTKAIYFFKINNTKYDSWKGLYKRKYKYNIIEYANTYKLRDNVYVYGFTESQMIEIGPFTRVTYKKLSELNIFPLPEMEGYRFKKNKVSSTTEKFYLLTEALAYFNFWENNKNKITNLNDTKTQLYIKKKLWESMQKAREEFNNE